MILNFIKQKHIYKKLKSRNNQDKMLNVLSAAEEDFSSSSYFVFCYFCLIQFLLSWKTNPSFQLALAATLFLVLHDFPPTHRKRVQTNSDLSCLGKKFKKRAAQPLEKQLLELQKLVFIHIAPAPPRLTACGGFCFFFFVNNEATQKPEKL